MSPAEAIGILKNWQNKRTSLSVLSQNDELPTSEFGICRDVTVSVSASGKTLVVVGEFGKQTVELEGAVFSPVSQEQYPLARFLFGIEICPKAAGSVVLLECPDKSGSQDE